MWLAYRLYAEVIKFTNTHKCTFVSMFLFIHIIFLVSFHFDHTNVRTNIRGNVRPFRFRTFAHFSYLI